MSMKIWQSLILASLALSLTSVSLAGDVSRGQELSASCAACHGADGISGNPEWPNLAGQNARYTYEQLKAYKSGDRENALMAQQVQDLSDEDMKHLAAFYAAQTPSTSGAADPDLVDLGAEIYHGGLPDKGVAACMACHGPAGGGMSAAGWPAIAGQHATYSAIQLTKYRDGERRNSMMQSIAERLTDEEIEAVSSYMNGLHRRSKD